jgi:hypothetical protein
MKGYILQDRDGDYVLASHSGKHDSVKMFFDFTPDRDEAAIYTYDDLWSKLATTATGVEFTRGYAGGKAIPVQYTENEQRERTLV